MSQLAERIAQFRKMATDDPDNELGHFRLGQLLMEDGQPAEAVKSFERALELSPFSKLYELLGACLIQLGEKEKAVDVLTRGWKNADEKGDRLPKEAMSKLLRQLGAPIPEAQAAADDGTPGTGFHCQRPGCMEGKRARQLPAPPVPDEIGQRIYETVCAGCWNYWFRDLSIKVINELRLDLSSEHGQAEYDKHMREFFGFDQ
jgi:Fe-S cluster biosynthesis and repair protein YggX